MRIWKGLLSSITAMKIDLKLELKLYYSKFIAFLKFFRLFSINSIRFILIVGYYFRPIKLRYGS